MLEKSLIAEKLTGYPPEVLQHCLNYAKNRDSKELDLFMIHLLFFLIDREATPENINLPADTHLRNELGIESITIAEVIFLLEDIFQVQVEDAEIVRITTLGELKDFVRYKASGLS